ncbi:unnamed protein product [Owenia fusiformis]|uniref:Uncharacterized protein n=1 Tax=Owenia fusiformis TaxID=6347 RepID=A0A8S4NS02_OWEFU|nr:unnamed protein product [Owenia fusiformis]
MKQILKMQLLFILWNLLTRTSWTIPFGSSGYDTTPQIANNIDNLSSAIHEEVHAESNRDLQESEFERMDNTQDVTRESFDIEENLNVISDKPDEYINGSIHEEIESKTMENDGDVKVAHTGIGGSSTNSNTIYTEYNKAQIQENGDVSNAIDTTSNDFDDGFNVGITNPNKDHTNEAEIENNITNNTTNAHLNSDTDTNMTEDEILDGNNIIPNDAQPALSISRNENKDGLIDADTHENEEHTSSGDISPVIPDYPDEGMQYMGDIMRQFIDSIEHNYPNRINSMNGKIEGPHVGVNHALDKISGEKDDSDDVNNEIKDVQGEVGSLNENDDEAPMEEIDGSPDVTTETGDTTIELTTLPHKITENGTAWVNNEGTIPDEVQGQNVDMGEDMITETNEITGFDTDKKHETPNHNVVGDVYASVHPRNNTGYNTPPMIHFIFEQVTPESVPSTDQDNTLGNIISEDMWIDDIREAGVGVLEEQKLYSEQTIGDYTPVTGIINATSVDNYTSSINEQITDNSTENRYNKTSNLDSPGQDNQTNVDDFDDDRHIKIDTTYVVSVISTGNDTVADYSNTTLNGNVTGNGTVKSDFIGFLSKHQFSWIDIIIATVCSIGAVLFIVQGIFFLHFCVTKCRCHLAKDFTPHQPLTPPGEQTAQSVYTVKMDSVKIKSSTHTSYNKPNRHRRPKQSHDTLFQSGSMDSGSSTTSSVGTQYENTDAFVASFLSSDLIVELNDRDSACTEISDGFTFSRDFQLPEISTEL